MAKRYPGTALQLGAYDETFGTAGSFNQSGSAVFNIDATGDGVSAGEQATLFCAPARYSEVRKVAFWVALRHEHSDTAATFECRLRIMPRKASAAATDLDTFILNFGDSEVSFGTGTVINQTYSSDRLIVPGPTAKRNSEIPDKIASTTTNGVSCVLWVEYDRFASDAASIEFFQLWDSADNDDSDEYCGFIPWIQRMDGGTFTSSTGSVNNSPKFAGVGMSIVQAGSDNNKTCTMWAGQYPERLDANSASYQNKTVASGALQWRAADWDGVDSISAIVRQRNHANGGRLDYKLERFDAATASGPLTVVGAENTLTSSNPGNHNHISRTRNLLTDILANGDDNYCLNFKHDTGLTVATPFFFWEIVQTNATKSRVLFRSGVGNQPDAGDMPAGDEWGRDAGLIDPLWFEDLDNTNFADREIDGNLLHASASNNGAQYVFINANLDGTFVGSGFNQQVDPGLSSTPLATTTYKLVKASISDANDDPVNLAGKRMIFLRLTGTWTAGTVGRPHSMAISYTLNLPAGEAVDNGPLFELDAFNPEGCASTAAGLGDNPGVLAIVNGSTAPQKFNPDDKTITELGILTPFRGELPQAVPADDSDSPVGGLGLGDYVYRYTFRNSCTGKESDPNPEDIEVDTSGQSPAAKVTLSFANVTIPGDSQIDEICIYRSIEGGAYPILAKVGCFKIDETSIFLDQKDDTALDFTNDGLSLLNGYPLCCPIVVEFRNRLALMGDIPQLSPDGTVTAVNGSDTLTFSVDAVVDRCMVGRFIQIDGDCKKYEIQEILPSLTLSPQQLRVKLTQDYEGTSTVNKDFIICGRPNRVYFSEPLEPDYWPAANFIDIDPGDGDRIQGAVSNYNGIVICKRRKTYVLRFNTQPATEVFVPALVSSDIGCIAYRSFAQVNVGSVWLADRGLALFDGRSVRHVPASDNVNDIFVDPDHPLYVKRDKNGRVVGAVGAFYPKREQYLLLLPTVGSNRGANLMLVWDTSLNNITLFHFCQEFTSMEVAKDVDGNERVYLGDGNGFVWIFDTGNTDGVGYPNATGTVSGTITSQDLSEGVTTLNDSAASFLTGGIPELANLSAVAGFSGLDGSAGLGIAGACIHFRPAGSALDTPWETRFVFASTSTKLYVTPSISDDVTGYEYMLGAIEFVAEFKPSNFGTDDFQKRNWQQILTHEPEEVSTSLRIELLPDFQNSDPDEGSVTDTDGEVGQGRTFDLSYTKGRQLRPIGRLIYNFQQVRMKNFAPDQPVRILQHTLRVTPKSSR